ncbi:MAG: hypothetical protein ACOX2G_12770 [Bacillota bacterium]|jgi:hypothetical protein
MSCSSNCCNHQAHAQKFIRQAQPQHLVLAGSCCNVRGMLGAAPRVTVLGAQVEGLASLALDCKQERVRVIATSAPSLSLSRDPADIVYLCENVSTLTARDFAELAAVLKPGGAFLLSARFSQGELPREDWPGVKDLGHWLSTLREAGFARVEFLAESVLIFSCGEDGQLIYSVSEGLLKATKEESTC